MRLRQPCTADKIAPFLRYKVDLRCRRLNKICLQGPLMFSVAAQRWRRCLQSPLSKIRPQVTPRHVKILFPSYFFAALHGFSNAACRQTPMRFWSSELSTSANATWRRNNGDFGSARLSGAFVDSTVHLVFLCLVGAVCACVSVSGNAFRCTKRPPVGTQRVPF